MIGEKSNLIHFGRIWSKKIKNKTAIFILSVTFYSNFFWLVRNPIWSILDGFDPKKIKNKTAIFIFLKNVTTLYTNIFWYLQPLRSFFSDRQTDARKPHRHRSSNSSLDWRFLDTPLLKEKQHQLMLINVIKTTYFKCTL